LPIPWKGFRAASRGVLTSVASVLWGFSSRLWTHLLHSKWLMLIATTVFSACTLPVE
jgi:hypothetical protein